MTVPHAPHPAAPTAEAVSAVQERPVTYYTLPARLLAAGMSTPEGRVVLSVAPPDDTGWVAYTITGRHDPVQRYAPGARRIDLAVFPDAATDGSTLPDAVLLPGPEPDGIPL